MRAFLFAATSVLLIFGSIARASDSLEVPVYDARKNCTRLAEGNGFTEEYINDCVDSENFAQRQLIISWHKSNDQNRIFCNEFNTEIGYSLPSATRMLRCINAEDSAFIRLVNHWSRPENIRHFECSAMLLNKKIISYAMLESCIGE